MVLAGLASGGCAACFGLYRSCPPLIYFSMVSGYTSWLSSPSSEASSSSLSSYPLASCLTSASLAACSSAFFLASSFSCSICAFFDCLDPLASFCFLGTFSTSLIRFYLAFSCLSSSFFLVSSTFYFLMISSRCFWRSRSLPEAVRFLPVV